MYQAMLTAPMYFPNSVDLSSMRSTMFGATTSPPFYQPVPVTHALPDSLRCGYTSKRCENPRTVKKSCGLHRFCAYHRERANKNQWRVDNRRRILRKKGKDSKDGSGCASPQSTSSSSGDDCDAGDQVTVKLETVARSDGSEAFDGAGSPDMLSEQDATILNAMLFGDDDAEETRTAETCTPVYESRGMEAVPTYSYPQRTMASPTYGAMHAARSHNYAHV